MVARAASAADQTVYSAWVRGLELALSGSGFVSGGTPSAQGTPDMTVALAAGSYRISGTTYTLAGQNATITAAHATLTRTDLISVDSTGTATVTAGTPAAAPSATVLYADPPDLPSGHVPIALVEVGANQASITDSRIVDIRSIIPLARDLIDAKGDLLAGTASDAIARVAVGTNGQLLKSDSTAGAGVSWVTHDSTGDPHTQYPTQTEFDDHSARHDAGGADALTADAAAGTASLRSLGTTSTTAAAGNHTHPATGVSVQDKVVSTTTVVNTTTNTSLYSYSVPGNTIGANGGLRLTAFGDALNNSGAGSTITFDIKFGATTVLTSAALTFSASADRPKWFATVMLRNAAATNAQRVGVQMLFSLATSDNWSMGGGGSGEKHGAGYGTAAEDTTAAKTLALAVTLGNAAATIDCRIHAATLELLP